MILVTGATGFVGRHLVDRLAPGGGVRALVRRESGLPAGVEAVRGDITEPETLPAALEGVATVVHAAAITGDRKEPYRGAYDAVNHHGTANLRAAARAAGVRRLVVVSGLGTRPAPPGSYMATRWAAEEAVRASGIPFVILQPSVLFGDGAPFVSALAGLSRVSPVVPVIGSGRLRFQPLWVEDLVTCIESACTGDGLLGRTQPLGGPAHVTFREVMQIIGEATGRRRPIVPLPLALARVQAALMTAVLPRPPLTPAALELFGFDNTTEVDIVQRVFGFRPRDFREHLLANGVDG